MEFLGTSTHQLLFFCDTVARYGSNRHANADRCARHLFSDPLITRMYAIAGELLQPFGNDLNDLDLDRLADGVAADVLYIGQNYRDATSNLVTANESTSRALYQHGLSTSRRQLDSQTSLSKVTEFWRLLFHAVPLRRTVLLALWASTCVLSTFFLKQLPASSKLAPYISALLSPDSSIKGYVGYALFSLLGFRLFDSHGRYTRGQELWYDGIVMNTRLLANRIFEAYRPGTWHKGDLERIAAYLSAIAVTTAAKLRGEDCRKKLSSFMGPADVQAIMQAPEQADHCVDVVRAYLIKGDELQRKDPQSHSAGGIEHRLAMSFLGRLRKQVSECERLVRIPVPFGYVQHSKIFLNIWLAMLPLGLAEVHGWLTVPLVIVLAYGVLGIEKWAEELSDPFGDDISDLPLDQLCTDAMTTVESNLQFFKDGTNAVIKPERKSFPAV